MELLKTEQRRIYEWMRSLGARGFLRVCHDDDALWVSDAVRRECSLGQIVSELESEGIVSRIDRENGLMYLDWSAARWEAFADELPTRPPRLPKNEQLHEAYALCRLYLAHAHEQKNLRPVRRLLKLLEGPVEPLLKEIPFMTEQAAQSIRQGLPAGFEAGRLLAAWLTEKERV